MCKTSNAARGRQDSASFVMAEPAPADASCACQMAHQRAAQLCCNTDALYTSSSSDEEETAHDATPLLAQPANKSKLRGVHIKAVPGLRVIYDALSAEEEAAASSSRSRSRGSASDAD